MRPLLVLVGPTAVGKTALSLDLALGFGGEIISADSRLVYRGMDIGTAKPSRVERAAVPHHLIDICDPDETISLGAYQRLAYAAIDDVLARGRLPILVGGTGQYVAAVTDGWSIPEVAPNDPLREALGALGAGEAARWLDKLDPAAAGRIDPRNTRRVIRALEVTLTTGRRMSDLQRRDSPDYDILPVGIGRERDDLYRRIDERVDAMMRDGLLAELEGLRAAGYGRDLPSMSGLGYRQLWAYLDGELTLPEAVARIKFETHRLVRQQATWFRAGDTRIAWFNFSQAGAAPAATALVNQWLSSGGRNPRE
jgi:tRNA dimethylallyltransferase